MSEVGRAADTADLRALYDESLPHVFGYLLHRCGDRTLAEDLTQEVFLAAARALRTGTRPEFEKGWLIGIARHKLVDHFRRLDRDRRTLELVTDQVRTTIATQHVAPLVRDRALKVLADLPVPQRLALVLRYFDGLSVPEIAAHLHRSVHATESVLARAREGFRRRYLEVVDD